MEVLESIPKFNQKQAGHASTFNNYYKKLIRKELTLEEFEIEIANWFMVDFFDLVKYKPLPTKPMAVIDFEEKYRDWKAKAESRKMQFDEETFFEKQMKKEVEKYYEGRNRIQNINKSNLYWLQEMKKIITLEDGASHYKLDQKIMEFRESI